jgi:hypothetical protein
MLPSQERNAAPMAIEWLNLLFLFVYYIIRKKLSRGG